MTLIGPKADEFYLPVKICDHVMTSPTLEKGDTTSIYIKNRYYIRKLYIIIESHYRPYIRKLKYSEAFTDFEQARLLYDVFIDPINVSDFGSVLYKFKVVTDTEEIISLYQRYIRQAEFDRVKEGNPNYSHKEIFPVTLSGSNSDIAKLKLIL